MKIVLLIPPWNYSILKGNNSSRAKNADSDVTSLGILPPTGILCIGSALKAQGHFVNVIDGYFNGQDEILKIIIKTNPDVVGISTISCLWNETRKLCKAVKEALPDVKIILGGHHVNYAKGKSLEDIPETASIVIGQGEQTMIEIVKKLENGEKIEKIYYADPKKIPRYFEPDYELLDGPVNRYIPNIGLFCQLPFIHMFTTIGCGRHCAFCNVGKSTANLQIRNAPEIINEIQNNINKYNIKTINFYDDSSIFETNRNEAVKLCNEIIKQKISFKWSIYLTNFQLDDELLALMRSAGCFRIHCAIESGVQKNRDYIRGNHISLSLIEDQIARIKNSGIETYGRFMFGILNESYEEGRQTIQYARQLKLDYASFIRCLLAPGTKMFEDLSKMGKINKDISKWNYYNDFYQPYPMNNAQVSKLIKQAYINFYFKPSVLYNMVKKIHSLDELKKIAVFAKRFI
ncbi:MAG: cobalamin-dependent protein [bacterium]|nr:cobalamin-dependent protein [bacterium]